MDTENVHEISSDLLRSHSEQNVSESSSLTNSETEGELKSNTY